MADGPIEGSRELGKNLWFL